MILQHRFRYDFDTDSFRTLTGEDTLSDGFLLRLRLTRLPEGPGETVLLETQGLRILTRVLSADTYAPVVGEYEYGEQYHCHFGADRKCPVLEAEIRVAYADRPDWNAIRIGFPLRCYNAVENEVFLVYDGLRLQWIMDGELLNENMPVGALSGRDKGHDTLRPDAFSLLEITNDLSALRREAYTKRIEASFNYYHPPGYNAWAGDVSLFFHDGVYHLVYFVDRHHHQNRWGTGAHSVRHVTTRDFVLWEDHGPLFELTEPWQAVGTGTMFFHRGRYYFAHGYHTGRAVATERLAHPLFAEMYRETGETRALSHAVLFEKGLVPDGANYAVSDDGLSFLPGGQQFHWVENPSVYADENGLRMVTGNSSWTATDITGPWRLQQEGFPPCGTGAAMRNSDECPSLFTWNGFSYLIMGATGFWRTQKDCDTFFDSAALGYDVYDGLFVPMATKIADNRVILAGWIYGIGWGSYIIHRELIQYPDGRLGMKWMPELSPDKRGGSLLERSNVPIAEMTFECSEGASYYYEIDMETDPGEDGWIAVHFEGEKGCALRLDFGLAQAQISGLSRDAVHVIPPAYIGIPEEVLDPALPYNHLQGKYPYQGVDFSIAHVDVMRGAFALRIVQRYSPKGGLTLIDAEIAGQRTLVSNRAGLHVRRVSLHRQGNARVHAFRVYAGEREIPF